MLEFEQLKQDISALPEEAQRLVADFVAFLKQRYQHTFAETHQPLDLDNDPFVGMWSDRTDMRNSTDWVRQVRQQHWRI